MKVLKVASNDSKTEEWETNKNMYIQLVRIKVTIEKRFTNELNCINWNALKLVKLYGRD